MYEDSYGRSGLSHITIAGATHHGMKDVSVCIYFSFVVCLVENYVIKLNFVLEMWSRRLKFGFKHLLQGQEHLFIGILVKRFL